MNYFPIKVLFFIIVFSTLKTLAQVGIGTTSPLAETSLQIDGTDTGVLINRVSLLGTDDTTTVPSLGLTHEGLMVYNTNSVTSGSNSVFPGFYYWNGTRWKSVKESGARKTGWVAMNDSNTAITIAGISASQTADPANFTNIPIDFEDNIGDSIIDTFAPEGYSGADFFNSSTNRITAINLGDAIELRLQFNAIPDANNSFLVLAIDIGTTSPIIIFEKTVPLLRGSGEVNKVSESILLYQLNTFLLNGAQLKIAYSVTSGSPGDVVLSKFGMVIERLSTD